MNLLSTFVIVVGFIFSVRYIDNPMVLFWVGLSVGRMARWIGDKTDEYLEGKEVSQEFDEEQHL